MLEHFCDAGMSSVVVHDVSVLSERSDGMY